MKFDKELKSGAKKQGYNKKHIIGLIIAVVMLVLMILPMALGGLK